MSKLFRLSGAAPHDPRIDAWFAGASRLAPDIDALLPELGDDLRHIARLAFDRMRACGPNVREILHDGHPFACVGDAPFAYVDRFRAHVNVGFMHGHALADPAGLLEGSGRRMRHVKVRSAADANAPALSALIAAAYRDIQARIASA